MPTQVRSLPVPDGFGTEPNMPSRNKFASDADFDSWRADLWCYGQASFDEGGKHIPLNEGKG